MNYRATIETLKKDAQMWRLNARSSELCAAKATEEAKQLQFDANMATDRAVEIEAAIAALDGVPV